MMTDIDSGGKRETKWGGKDMYSVWRLYEWSL